VDTPADTTLAVAGRHRSATPTTGPAKEIDMLNPNVPAWFEIPTRDLDRAQRFYEAALDTTLQRQQFGGALQVMFFKQFIAFGKPVVDLLDALRVVLYMIIDMLYFAGNIDQFYLHGLQALQQGRQAWMVAAKGLQLVEQGFELLYHELLAFRQFIAYARKGGFDAFRIAEQFQLGIHFFQLVFFQAGFFELIVQKLIVIDDPANRRVSSRRNLN